jgi:hypothetical protein
MRRLILSIDNRPTHTNTRPDKSLIVTQPIPRRKRKPQTATSLVSSPGWLPDPFLRIFSRNVHRGKHGSDQEVYDHEGRFIPQARHVGFCVIGDDRQMICLEGRRRRRFGALLRVWGSV